MQVTQQVMQFAADGGIDGITNGTFMPLAMAYAVGFIDSAAEAILGESMRCSSAGWPSSPR